MFNLLNVPIVGLAANIPDYAAKKVIRLINQAWPQQKQAQAAAYIVCLSTGYL